jgi:hypothetical protein
MTEPVLKSMAYRMLKLPSAPARRIAPVGESQLRQERNICRKPIHQNLKPRPGRNMPLLTELGWFFSLRGYKDAAPPGLLRPGLHPTEAGC